MEPSLDLTWLLESIRAPAAPDEGQNMPPAPTVGDTAEGARNQTLASLAGTMRRRGMDQETIAAALLAHNRLRCRPPLEEDEVLQVAASVSRYDPREIGGFDEVLTWDGGAHRATPDELTPESAQVGRYVSEPPPPVSMLIRDVIPERVVGMLAGAGGVGKTSLLCELAVAMAGGRCAFGLWQPTRPLKVAALIKEDDDEDLWRMLYRAAQAPIVEPTDLFGVDPASLGDRQAFLRRVTQNLRARSLIGRSTVLIEQDGKRSVVSRWYGELVAYLERLRDDMGGLDVVMLDPMRRFSNCDENDSNAANMLIEAFDRIRDTLGCTVLTTHHIGKGGDVTKAYASRGSSALEDGGRFVLNVGRISEERELASLGLATDRPGAYLKLVNVKNTKVRRAAQLVVERTKESTFEALGTYADLRDACRVGTRKALDHYQRLFPSILAIVQEVPGQYTPRSMAQEQGGMDGPLEAGRDTVRQVCESAVERGDLQLVTMTNAAGRKTGYLAAPGWEGWNTEGEEDERPETTD